jgi:hypothetical protein
MLTKIQKKEPIFQNEKVEIFKIRGAKYDKLEEKLKREKDENKRKDIYKEIKNLAYFHSVKKNVVCLAGRTQICKVLAGETVLSTKDLLGETFPNVCAIGTDDTAHDENSTALYAEDFRKYISSREPKNNQLVVLSHYLKEDCEGNYREEAAFMKADVDTADDGELLSVVALDATEGNKTSSDALIVERTFTLSIPA